jgi:hypothetical protein
MVTLEKKRKRHHVATLFSVGPSRLSKTPKGNKKLICSQKTEVQANKRGGDAEQRHITNDRRRDDAKRGKHAQGEAR